MLVSVQRSHLVIKACLLFSLFALAGCGGSEFATVEGKVIVDGQPVTAGRVIFQSMDGKSSIIAKIAPDGSYRALDVPCGAMNVFVTPLDKVERIRIQRGGTKGKKSSESEALAKAVESSPKIPEKYEDADTSRLTFTVKSGTNTYNIEILSK